jgi:hypothetical protein
MKKKLAIGLFVAIVAMGILATGKRPDRQAQAWGGEKPAALQRVIPHHVAYEFLFRYASSFKDRARRAGKPEALDVALKQGANLQHEQMRALYEIADACLQEVEEQDRQARAVISKFRSQFPGGVVPRDQRLPAPPPELAVMQQQRNAILLRGRARLSAALGKSDFDRLDEFVLRRFGGNNAVRASNSNSAVCCDTPDE